MDNVDEKVIPSPTVTDVGEVTLITESDWQAARALRATGLAKAEIARQLGYDVKTIRMWLRRNWKPQQRRRQKRLDVHEAFLRARAPEVGFNTAVLFREVCALGYEGTQGTVGRYIHAWRPRADTQAVERFETAPGEQAQVDWGSTNVWIGEKAVRVHVFAMVLGYSRRIFAYAYLHERLSNLLDAHERAFAYFGGRTRTILYDNPRTIVHEKNAVTGEIQWNEKFRDRMRFYGVEVRLCQYYRAQTKGKIENGVKYVKRNALAGRCFRSLEDLNDWMLEWCGHVADDRVHGTTHEVPRVRFDLAEAGALIAVDGRPAPPLERAVTRVVPRDTLVAVETNRYPVPLGWVGRTVDVRVAGEEVVIGSGEESVHYVRIEGKHQVARWAGPARDWHPVAEAAAGRPRFDPVYGEHLGFVEQRSLAEYDALIGEVA
jgi:transposase